MQQRQRFIFVYICVAVGALVLLAAGLPQLAFEPGHAFALPRGLFSPGAVGAAPFSMGDPNFWRVVFTAIFMIMAAVLVIGLVVSRKLRREFLRRMLLAFAVILFIYLAVNLLQRMPADTAGAPPSAPAPAPTAAAAEPLPPFVAAPAPWLTIVVSVLLGLLLIAAIWWFWRRNKVEQPANPLVAVAEEAIASIQSGGDVHDTVLRCYLDMSRVLSEQRGIDRPGAITPREFERQLAAAGVRDQHVRQLTALFERARYSAEPPTERDQRAAVECLSAIVQTYGAAHAS